MISAELGVILSQFVYDICRFNHGHICTSGLVLLTEFFLIETSLFKAKLWPIIDERNFLYSGSHEKKIRKRAW